VLATATFLLVPAVLREILLRYHPPEEVRMMTFARLDSIFYGVAMVFAVHRFKIIAAMRRWMLGAGAMLIGIAVLMDALTPPAVSYRIGFFIVPGGFALMLPWLEAIQTLPAGMGWAKGAVQRLSVWSYSIYLCHIPILFSVYALFDPWRGHWAINVLSKVVGLAATLAAARMIYMYFERPLTDMRPREEPAPAAPRVLAPGPRLFG
jgi:peptidoglycan/LPS O-acetylase OafA/YrhL